jgi:hypothetical protein
MAHGSEVPDPAATTPDAAAADETAREILDHLRRHPGAADSLEGLARWRLVEATVWRTLDETERALHWLVARGWVREIARPHAAALFTLDEAHRDDVARFLDR